MNQTDRQEMKLLCERATPGPWVLAFEPVLDGNLGAKKAKPRMRSESIKSNVSEMEIYSFAAAARTAIPALLSQIEGLESDLVAAKSRIAELEWKAANS